jgi:predicted transposase YdaD
MAQSSDITSKRLVSISPEDWVRWGTDIEDVGDCEVLNTEFQLVSRNTDALVLVNDSSVGKFLTLFEIQTRYSKEMPQRMCAYSALARAKYNLPVFPILVNILRYGKKIPTKYESNFVGIEAKQDYRVINLWEVEAEEILTRNLSALIPFIPTMKGGTNKELLQRAQIQLEFDEELRGTTKLGDLETALRIFAKAILGDKANDILRWTMIDLILESPYYKEIIGKGQKEGRKEGRKEESERLVSKQLVKRFGTLDKNIKHRLKELSLEQTESLAEAIFDFNDIDDVRSWLSKIKIRPTK